MHTSWIACTFGALFILSYPSGCTGALQCYEISCNGTNCLGTEVARNPLLINKCSRIIYKGCYTVTTSISGFSLTMAGCVDRMFECSAGTCAGTFLKTKVSCCNEDLCNTGQMSSASDNKQFQPVDSIVLWIVLYKLTGRILS